VLILGVVRSKLLKRPRQIVLYQPRLKFNRGDRRRAAGDEQMQQRIALHSPQLRVDLGAEVDNVAVAFGLYVKGKSLHGAVRGSVFNDIITSCEWGRGKSLCGWCC